MSGQIIIFLEIQDKSGQLLKTHDNSGRFMTIHTKEATKLSNLIMVNQNTSNISWSCSTKNKGYCLFA